MDGWNSNISNKGTYNKDRGEVNILFMVNIEYDSKTQSMFVAINAAHKS